MSDVYLLAHSVPSAQFHLSPRFSSQADACVSSFTCYLNPFYLSLFYSSLSLLHSTLHTTIQTLDNVYNALLHHTHPLHPNTSVPLPASTQHNGSTRLVSRWQRQHRGPLLPQLQRLGSFVFFPISSRCQAIKHTNQLRLLLSP